MKRISINRTTLPLEGLFPKITEFPVYDNPDPNTAVLMRLFTQANYAPLAQTFIPMALWSMRSVMLNSDMRHYKPTIVFHCDDRLYDMGKPVFEEAGVPPESIIVYNHELVPTTLENPILHLAAAPLLDPQLEQFHQVIVLDADLFALGNSTTGLLPLMRVSLQNMPDNDIALLRGWTHWDPVRDEYTNWYDHGQRGKSGFLREVASYCETTPDAIESILYPDNLKENARPFHNGAYISIPMQWLRANPRFREFIRDASGTLGNEEIAMAVWGIKRYLEDGIRWPEHNIQDYIVQSGAINLSWDLDEAWSLFTKGQPAWAHLYSFDGILDYAYDWSMAIGGSESESLHFTDVVRAKVDEMNQ